MAGQRGLTAAVRPDDGGKFPFLICAVTSLSASKVLPSSVSKVWETWQISKALLRNRFPFFPHFTYSGVS